MASVAGAIRAGRAFIELLLDDSGLIHGLARAGQRLQNFGRALIGLGLQLSAPFIKATETFAKFDDAMRAAGAVSTATADQLARLTDEARRLGATTSFTATEAAELMVILGKAGFKPDAIISATGAILNLSRATGENTTRSAEVAAAALNQFRLSASETTRVVDVLTQIANKSAATIDDLFYTFKYAAPTARGLDIPIEKFGALAAALANLGIRGQTAGTSIRRLLTLTAADSQEFERTFGVSMRDAAGAPRDIIDVLSDLDESLKGLDVLDRTEKLYEFFGLLGITAAEGLTAATLNMRDLEKAMKEAGGTAERVAKQMDAGIGGAIRKLKSTWQDFVLEVGEAIAPALKNIADWIRENLKVMGEFIGQNQALVIVAAAAGPALIILGGALVVVGTAVTALAAVISLAASAIGFFLTPLGAVGGALVWLALQTESARKTSFLLGSAWKATSDATVASWRAIGQAIKAGELGIALELALQPLKIAWITLWDSLMEGWESWRDSFLNNWNALITTAAHSMVGLLKIPLKFLPATTAPALEAQVEALQALLLQMQGEEKRGREMARERRIEGTRREILKIRTRIEELQRMAKAASEARAALERIKEFYSQVPFLDPFGVIPERAPWRWWVMGTQETPYQPGAPTSPATGTGGMAENLADAVAGTFSARIAGRLGGESPMQKQNKISLDQLDELKRIRRTVESGNPLRFS